MRITGGAIGQVCGLALLSCAVGLAKAEDAMGVYPAMAPIAQYRAASPTEEVALARSAAPTSISADAEVMTLGDHGYETAIRGKNGFVCLVERSWGAGFGDAEFWNPKIRGPICLNAAGARTVLPAYLERSQWVLAGMSKSDMIARIKAEIAANRFVMPDPGAMSYMMSKQGYLSDAGGHWHPHLMFFLAHTDGAAWGANLTGSPIISAQEDPDPVTTFMVSVTRWSDGTAAASASLLAH
jgi:hypothetical protein